MKAAALFLLGVVLLAGCDSRPVSTPDVVIVTIDTLRADRLGSYGHAAAQTPVLDRLAAEGVRFDQASSPVPITLPSHASIFTGQLPSTHGVRNNSTYHLGSSPPTLAEEFQRRGYATAAAVAAIPLVGTGLERGFDVYDDYWEDVASTDEFLMAERSADAVADAALGWLQGQGDERPVFLWVHLFEPHMPYTLVPPFDRTFADSPYDGEVAAADRAVGRLLDGFTRGRSRARVTVVTSDHGEGLGEHGEDTHAIFLYQSTLRVPLIVHAPDLLDARVETTPVGLIDIVPTLASVLGWKEHGLAPDGVAVLPRAPADRDLHAESLFGLETYRWSPLFAVRRGDRKVIQGNLSSAFDLATDPAELKDLTGATWVDDLRADLREWVGAMPPLGASVDGNAPTPQEVAALEALGYVGGAPSVTTDDLLAEMDRLPDPTRKMDDFQRMTDARAALNEERFADAIASLQPVIEASPDNIWALLLLGNSYVKNGESAKAVPVYRDALAIAPEWIVLHKNLGEAYLELGQADEALTAYRAALALDPDRVDAALSAARLMQARGEFAEALALLAPALGRDDLGDDERADLLAARARLQLQSGDLQASAQSLAEARRLDDRAELLTLQALLNRRGAQWQDNLRLLTDAPDLSAEALLYLGEAHQMLGHAEAAARRYRACLAANDDVHLAHNNLAWILAVDQRRPADALPHALRALDLHDGEPEYHDTFLEILERMQRWEEARDHARVAATRFPQHAGLQARALRLEER